jgi:hypothetical protein
MRILLDECMPAGLGRDFAGHEVTTAPKMGWAGLKNGALLTRAVEAGFDVFLTVDRNLPNEQKLATYAIVVAVLRCPTNDITALRKLVPELRVKLPAAKKGEATVIG